MDDRERFEWNPTEERLVEITWPEFFRKFCKDNLRFSELAMEELDEHMERDKADGPAEAEPLACPAEVREAGGSITVLYQLYHCCRLTKWRIAFNTR